SLVLWRCLHLACFEPKATEGIIRMHRQAGEQGWQRVAMLPDTLTQKLRPIGPLSRMKARRRARSPLTLAILIFVALCLAACHQAAAPAPTSTVTVVISPTSISLNVGTRTTF